ncbi:hypothetical protein MAL08_17880 [Leptospira noguchii]|uniref:hypothetical protein n=1 Tax=Leptospira noguchii TaxID=28182 RepID=UPI0002C00532|nr:hypothetical protein [Leptospira noguchii]EMI63986.1 hypothetical protein LEP1GSC072_1381 [Leptospira noguchii str. Bonito]UOG39802.1 hypothetical protein MAL08_17880 [Leptospira noguchii]
MKKYKIQIFLFLLMMSIASLSIFYKLNLNKIVDSIDLENQTESEIQKAWIQFANSILAGDLKETKRLSTNCIYCPECLTNTPEEESKYQDSNYDKFYSNLSYISIDTFLEKDIPLSLNAEIKAKLLNPNNYKIDSEDPIPDRFNRSCIISKEEFSSTKVYAVLVTVQKPTSESEGDVQRKFTFIRTKNGLRFCEYLSIP